MNEIDVIKGAREILASGRWLKYDLDDGKGNYCIYGAMDEVGLKLGNTEYTNLGLRRLAAHAMVEHIPNPAAVSKLFQLLKYNDDPNTTLQDMLDLIDKTLADKGALL